MMLLHCKYWTCTRKNASVASTLGRDDRHVNNYNSMYTCQLRVTGEDKTSEYESPIIYVIAY